MPVVKYKSKLVDLPEGLSVEEMESLLQPGNERAQEQLLAAIQKELQALIKGVEEVMEAISARPDVDLAPVISAVQGLAPTGMGEQILTSILGAIENAPKLDLSQEFSQLASSQDRLAEAMSKSGSDEGVFDVVVTQRDSDGKAKRMRVLAGGE